MTRSRVRVLAGAGALLLFAYLMALIAMAPAQVVWKLLEPRLDLPVLLQVGELSGSVWNGHAGPVRVEGREIGRLAWRWQPMAVLRGRLGLRLHWQAGADEADLLLQLGRGAVRMTNLRGGLDANRLQAWLDLPVLLDGRVDLDVGRIRWDAEAGFHQADGTLFWSNAAAGLPRPLALGLYRADLDTLDGALQARIEAAPESPLELQGTASWHPSTGHRLDLMLRAGSQADPALRSALDAIASRQTDGSHRLQLQDSSARMTEPAAARPASSPQASPPGQSPVPRDIEESAAFILP
jgi:general secretion pathway protein N